MEKLVRKVILQQVKEVDIKRITSTFIDNIKNILEFEYKLPKNAIKIDDLIVDINILQNKILNNYIDFLNKNLNVLLYTLNLQKDNESLENKKSIIFNAIENMPKFDADKIILDDLDNKMMIFKKISVIYGFEMLPGQIKRVYERYLDGVLKEIRKNEKLIKSGLQQVVNEMKNVDLIKSDSPQANEMLGINYDDKNNCFWIEEDGEKRKLREVSSEKELVIFQIDDQTNFILGQKKGVKTLGITKNGKPVKALSLYNNKLTYQSDSCYLENDLDSEEIIIRSNDREYKFNFNNISDDEKIKFIELLEGIDFSLKEYYERVNPELFKKFNNKSAFL